MNKADVVAKVAQKSGVAPEACTKVLDALEEVLSQELSGAEGLGGAFDKVQQLLQLFKKS